MNADPDSGGKVNADPDPQSWFAVKPVNPALPQGLFKGYCIRTRMQPRLSGVLMNNLFNLYDVVVTGERCDLSPVVSKASSGALELLPVHAVR